MQPHQHPPMTPRHRVILAVTVLSFLTVIGLVIGCDSDDGPKVTAPAQSGGGGGNGGNNAPTRDTTAEQQGRAGLEVTENGTMIRNKGEVALNVRFGYNTPRHYRLNPGVSMPSDPLGGGRGAPARVACGVPATGRANGQCYRNERGVATPEPYTNGPKLSLESRTQGRACLGQTNDELINRCSSTTLNVGFACNTANQFTHHYRINPGGRMTKLPLMRQDCPAGTSGLTTGHCAAPGVAQISGQGGYVCYINTGIVPVVYTGTPARVISPQPSSLYGSLAVGRDSESRRSSIRYGRTVSEARSNARSVACRGTVCRSVEFGRGQCAALAVGEGGGEAGAGLATGNSKLDAQNSALATCRGTGATNCRIATADDGTVFSACLTSSSTRSSVRQQSGVF